MRELENAYRVLDLEPGASMEEVNQAYKDLVFIWHPDRLPKDNLRLVEKAQEKLKQLNHARDYLRTHGRVGSTVAGASQPSYGSRNAYGRGYSSYRPHTAADPSPGQGSYNRYGGYQAHYYGRSQQSSQANTAGAKGANQTQPGAAEAGGPYEPSRNGGNGASASGNPSPNGNGGTPGTQNPGTQNPGYRYSPYGYNRTERQKRREAASYGRTYRPNEDASYYRDTWNTSQSSGQGQTTSGQGQTPGNGGPSPDPTRNGPGNTRQNPAYGSYGSYGSYSSPPHTATSGTASSNGRSRQVDPDLSGSDLRGANLQEKDFSGRNLSSADLSGANLKDTFLHKVNLNRANLSKANLFRANLLQANLSHANLREANLIGADLSGADLSGADLSGAQVTVGNKVMVKLTGTILRGAILPDGSIHP